MADDEVYFATFETSGIPKLVEGLMHLQRLYGTRGMRALEDGVGAILVKLLGDLQRLAVAYVEQVDTAIKDRIHATRWTARPPRDEMETHIVSAPGPFGGVGVAKISDLDKIINPNGWGPYWRAQEYGTGWGSYSQEGRMIFGTFYESQTPPDAAQQGQGAGHDLFFLPMGDAPGLGRISVELPARHFLRDGAMMIGPKWVEAMKTLEQGVMADLEALRKQQSAQRAGYTFIGRFDA